MLYFSRCKNKLFLLINSRLSELGDSSLFSINYLFFKTSNPHIYRDTVTAFLYSSPGSVFYFKKSFLLTTFAFSFIHCLLPFHHWKSSHSYLSSVVQVWQLMQVFWETKPQSISVLFYASVLSQFGWFCLEQSRENSCNSPRKKKKKSTLPWQF